MPTESILISIGVSLIFLLFAFVVAWADHTTSLWIRDKVDAKQASKRAHEPGQNAA
jgi:hypothetical protein